MGWVDDRCYSRCWDPGTFHPLGVFSSQLFVCCIYSFCNENKRECKSETHLTSEKHLGSAPSASLLPSGFGTMLSSVALLSILVFVPSAVVAVLLLVRMARKSAGLRRRGKSGYKKSSIEVSDE